MRKFVLALLMSLVPIGALAQTTPAPAASISAQTFSIATTAISLPGNRTTLAGTVAGVTMNVTTNLQLREDNVLSNGVNFYGGGFNYYLPVLSTKLNSASPNINGLRMHFYITGSFGKDMPSAGGSHYGFLAGGGGYYDLTGTGTWTFGAEIRYAKLPGYNNNTAVVAIGPSFHF